MKQDVKHPAIALADVCVTLPSRAGDVEILRGVDLNIKQDEAVAIAGPSGSGKTTLLMVTAGLERTTSGRVEISGQPLDGLSEDALASGGGKGLGFAHPEASGQAVAINHEGDLLIGAGALVRK